MPASAGGRRPAADYLRRFRAHRATLLAHGEVVGYAGRLDTAWALSLERLRDQDPAAVALLEQAAFLAPEPIPLRGFTGHPELLDEPLRGILADPDILADTVSALVGYSLARRERRGDLRDGGGDVLVGVAKWADQRIAVSPADETRAGAPARPSGGLPRVDPGGVPGLLCRRPAVVTRARGPQPGGRRPGRPPGPLV